MLFNYRVEIRREYCVLSDETTGAEIEIPYEHVKKVRSMLQKAKSLETDLQVQEWEPADLAQYLTGEAEVFVNALVEMGLVTPIQKQSKALGQDGR